MNKLNLIFLLSLVSCGIGGKMGALNFSVKVNESIRAEEVNFAVLQKEVLPKCIGCHQKWTTEDAFAKFITPGLPDESQFFDSVKTGRMPKKSPPLSTEKLEIVRNYILNMKVTETIPVPETQASFQDLQEKVFNVSCLPCHTKILNDETLLNEKWIDKTSPELSKLLIETESGRMPKRGIPLTSAQLELLRAYVNGFKQ